MPSEGGEEARTATQAPDRPFGSGSDSKRLLPDEPVADLEAYVASGGGEGLATTMRLAPEQIVAAVRMAGLRGRGGAGFPTGTKWASVVATAREVASPVYLVVNGAEGEPGTYKDRTLLTFNPFQVIEGALIALHAIGAQAAFVGVKERSKSAERRLTEALEAVREAGWSGADRLEMAPGPDEYLFGEEKAMLEVIEGKLPLPRIMPPYEEGLFATMASPNPTVVNNVETLANVPGIIAHGPAWFRQAGSDTSPGTMLFTVVGDVESPGVYELPLGTPLRTLLVDIAGARDTKAVYSGTSNPVITPALFDVPLGFDEFAQASIGLGSGGFIVYDHSHCIVRLLSALSHFLMIESCGQCPPCKLGTTAITELLDKIDRGEGVEDDIEAILQRCTTVTDGNRCYLPVGEQLTIGSTVHAFLDEFSAHLGSPCPSTHGALVPKIEHIDHPTGEVRFDPDYHRKRPDWSYAPS
ncbi:MAG: NADH-ubiquinone oxidoreductase-F iron-sulfur binding region domain-containing protein [Nitriliruptorales bacterium]